MKIGILTLPPQYNYGGIIQNWALQQTLLQLGHEPEMIFRLSDIPKLGLKLKALRCLSFLKCCMLKFLGHERRLCNPFAREYNVRISSYADDVFVDNEIRKSPKIDDDKELHLIIAERNYDAFIVGSDQVWREEYSPRIETYFLDFLPSGDNRPKIAYAASFGIDEGYISSEKMSKCQQLLRCFDAVSVREMSGVSIVRRDFGREDVQKVLDPTFLLNVNDYQSLILSKDRISSRFISAYILDDDYDKSEILADVADNRGLSLERQSIYYNEGMPTISQWLAKFADADFVVTDSFHGCVFSIMFQKPFIAIANKERGLSRFTSLLDELGLSSRLVLSYDEFKSRHDELLSSIDYRRVGSLLADARRSSIDFLKQSLSNK